MSIEPDPPTPVPAASGVGRILLWSARLTSIPILALVLVSLLPALAQVSMAAKEDKILAGCLSAVCVGLCLAWRWAGIGGAIIVASVGVMLAQNEGGLFGDPFSIAFGLQGLLFLLSAALNSPKGSSAGLRPVAWARNIVAGLLALGALAGAAVLLRGPEADPLPKGKELFAGIWESPAGLRMEVTAEGKATVSRIPDSKVDPWNLPNTTGGTGVFNFTFRSDDTIELAAGPFGGSKLYHIDRRPRANAKQVQMVLNGSDPYNPQGGMVLVKKAGTRTNALSKALKDPKDPKDR